MVRGLVVMVALLAAALGFAEAKDVTGGKDHPVLTRYPGSVIAWHTVANFSPYRIATGPVTGYRRIDDWLDTKGRLTRIYYVLDGRRTHADVYENYRKALNDAGFTVVADGFFKDSSQRPGIGSRSWLNTYFAANPFPAGESIDLLSGSSTVGGSAFLAGTVKRAAGTAHVAITITQQRADRVTYLIDVVEVAEAETGLVSVDAEAIGKGIDEHGRIALYGLHFDHDKATLTPASKPTLNEISSFLKSRPKLSFYVVGHTDSTGSLDYNLRLSRDRAAAVVEALVGGYGIARERLAPHGVGPLNPVFTNKADRGREQNRRVELVER